MTREELRGRNIIRVIAAALVIPQVLSVGLSLLMPNAGAASADWLRLGIAVTMAYLMLRGHSAARSYLAVSVFFGAVLVLVGSLVVLLKSPIAIVGIALGAGYIWAAWVLWKSPSVEAYIEARERSRDPILSLKSGDGV